MPLHYHTHLDATRATLCVWRIEETEDWFSEHIPVRLFPGHAKRRLQHLAGRYLLTQADPAFPYDHLRVSEHGRPYLEDRSRQFSISHSGNMAAVILSRDHGVGVDLEFITPRVLKVATRFLGKAEQSWIVACGGMTDPFTGKFSGPDAIRLCTLLWSAKEAAYKWLGVPGIDFAADLEIEPFALEETGQIKARCRKDGDLSFRIGYRYFDDCWLTWIAEPLTLHEPGQPLSVTR
jgi:phosphopantetheinyl transferase